MAKQAIALPADPIANGDVLSFDSDSLSLNGSSVTWQDTSHWWPAWPLSNYSYTTTWASPPLNPTEKAFRIVSAMMEKELVGELSVKEFVALVNDVAEIVRSN